MHGEKVIRMFCTTSFTATKQKMLYMAAANYGLEVRGQELTTVPGDLPQTLIERLYHSELQKCFGE